MPNHQERAASALARGPAKTEDIESARRGTTEARAAGGTGSEQAIGEIRTACAAIREDVDEIKRIVRTDEA